MSTTVEAPVSTSIVSAMLLAVVLTTKCPSGRRRIRTERSPSTCVSLRRAVLELATRLPQKAAENFVKVASRAKGGALADVVAATLVNNVARRVALLDELDCERRLAEVLNEVTAVIARMKAPPPPGGYLN